MGEELGIVVVQSAQWRVLLASVPVDDARVPLAERAAPAVLADEAYRVPVDQRRAECQQFAGGPVDLVLLDHGRAPGQLRGKPRMRREPFRQVQLRVDDALNR